jgi:hypothetical protein
MSVQDFAAGLQKTLEADSKLSRRGKRILEILDREDSPRRQYILNNWMAHSAAHLKVDAATANWTTVDWPTIIADLLPILLALLKIFLVAKIGPDDSD